MRQNPYLIAVPCILSKGMLPSERLVEIRLANGTINTAVVPSHFCWNAQGKIVEANEPAIEADGFLAARVVEQLPGKQTAVEIPDGAVIAVNDSDIKTRPTAILTQPHA
jgi:hypothetical protein